MDEATQAKLTSLLAALSALQKSTERALVQGLAGGTGRLAARTYQSLQRKIAELLPDDFYIAEALTLDLNDGMTDEQIAAQVQFAATQLIGYLETMVKTPRPRKGDFEDLRSAARDIQDQVVNVTRTTLRRALNDLDIDLDIRIPRPPIPPVPPAPPGVVRPGANLRDANLAGANLSGSDFTGANLRDANAEGANLSGASLMGVDAKRINMAGGNLSGATLEGANFYEANLEGANFTEARADGALFKHANLDHANFRAASVEGGNFVDTNVSGSDFTGANLVGANFRSAILDQVTFRGARLSGVNFRDANLDGADMTGAKLSGAIMPDGAIYINGMDLSRYGVIVTGDADDAPRKRKNGGEDDDML
jgi:uncharacterized protein YjbI with pentapeptide repeats